MTPDPSVPRCTAGLALLVAVLIAAPAAAQFDPKDPDNVGVIVLPLEPERESDRDMLFLLEDYLRNNLGRKLDRAVWIGADVLPALSGSPSSCLADPSCLSLLGAQFKSSLVASTRVSRERNDITLKVAWYSTGSGRNMADKEATFRAGSERDMVAAYAGWVDELFEPSLREKAGATSIGALTGGDEQDRRREEYYGARRKRKSARREDFGSGGERTDRDDPAADLRALVDEEEDEDDYEVDEPDPKREAAERRERERELERERERESQRERERESQRERERDLERERGYEEPEPGVEEEEFDDEDLDLDTRDRDTPKEQEARRREARREARDKPRDEVALEADDTTGGSIGGFGEAERAGYGPRERRRFERSGLSFGEYDERRWAFGKRLRVQVDFVWGLGGLQRRYSSLVHVREGGAKTEEYAWESLAASFVNPGFRINLGFAPVDLLDLGVGVGLMVGQQSLRREYIDEDPAQEVQVSICTEESCPDASTWKTATSLHWTIDAGARFFFVPKGRVKPFAGIDATFLFMAGYEIAPDGRYDHGSRPPAILFGLTPKGGVSISLSPFVALDIGVLGTIYLTQGEATHLSDEFFNGATPELAEAGEYLPTAAKEVPYPASPFMIRANIGVAIVF